MGKRYIYPHKDYSSWPITAGDVILNEVREDGWRRRPLEEQIERLCEVVGNIADRAGIDLGDVIEGVKSVEDK